MPDPPSPILEEQEPTFRGFLEGRGPVPLAYARWEHPAPKGRVVISHGYGEHGERYRHTAKWLIERGWSVSAMDHRGFGRSGGKRGDASGIRSFAEDLAFFLRHERNHDGDRPGAPARIVEGVPVFALPPWPQVVLGHSFGGLVAVLDLLWHADTLDGLILTSPAVALRHMGFPMRLLRKVLGLAAPHATLALPGDKRQACSDPILVRRYEEDPLCHRRASAAFACALAEGREEILHFGHELDRPILLLEAGDDTVVDPDGAEELWGAVRKDLLERRRLEGFKHEILHDLRRAEAQSIAEAWLDRLLEQWQGNPQALSTMFVVDAKETR